MTTPDRSASRAVSAAWRRVGETQGQVSKKFPFLKFFVDDWLAEERLRLCSLAARGLWIDLLCVMHKCDRRGYLMQANGQPYSLEQLARLTGCSTEEVAHLRQELLTSGVASANEHGVIFSRRMLRDEEISTARREAGSKGGKTTGVLLKQNSSKHPSKGLVSGILSSSLEEDGGAGEGETFSPTARAARKIVEDYQAATATVHDPRDAEDVVFGLLTSGAASEFQLAAAVERFGKHARKTYKPDKRMSARNFFGGDAPAWEAWIDRSPIHEGKATREDAAARIARQQEERKRLTYAKDPRPIAEVLAERLKNKTA
jgi:hypothetical protein